MVAKIALPWAVGSALSTCGSSVGSHHREWEVALHLRQGVSISALLPRYIFSLLCLNLGLFLTPKPFTYSCFPKDPEMTFYSPSVARTEAWFCYFWGFAHKGARPASLDTHVRSHARYAAPGLSRARGSWRWLTL